VYLPAEAGPVMELRRTELQASARPAPDGGLATGESLVLLELIATGETRHLKH
jgi:hypothetical protein